MNRRELLTVLAGAAIGAALHVEDALETATASLDNVPMPVFTKGWAPDGLAIGDIFTISGVYAVNPPGTKDLQRFVLTDLTPDSAYS